MFAKSPDYVDGKRPSPGRDKNLAKIHFDSDFYYPQMGETTDVQMCLEVNQTP